MLRIMIENWWLFACRAVFALIFSFYILFIQGANLPPLLRVFVHALAVVLFGLLAFGAGIFTLAAALRRSSHWNERGLLLADGLGICAAGAIVVMVPSLTLLPLIQIIGYWAVFAGICEMVMAHKVRRHLNDEWFLVLAGTGSLGFGAFLLLGWAFGDHIVLTWLGSYALFSAICMSGFAYRLWHAGALQHAQPVMLRETR
jgi:uncharacterized membrane protein HdeD (DUF308 family)